MDGWIKVVSKLGKGSTFTFCIALSDIDNSLDEAIYQTKDSVKKVLKRSRKGLISRLSKYEMMPNKNPFNSPNSRNIALPYLHYLNS
jgi:hypothetical protein